MSIFNKAVEAHEKAQDAANKAASAATAEKNSKESKFIGEFKELIASIVEPIFSEFAKDANNKGYPARTQHGTDGTNPYFLVTLIPEPGASFERSSASDACSYLIKGVVATQKVEYHSHYDQRTSRPQMSSGSKVDVFGIQSLKQSTIEGNLEDFITMVLKARMK